MILCFLTKLETRAPEQTGGDGSRAVGKSSGNKSAFPTPLCQEGVSGPCFSSGFCSGHSGQKLQVGQTHLERPAFSLLTPNDELFCFHLSAIASIWFIENYHKTQWHTEINVYFLLIYVLIDWSRLSWVWLSLCLGLDLLHVSFVTLGSAAPGSYFLWPHFRKSTCNTGDLGSIPDWEDSLK